MILIDTGEFRPADKVHPHTFKNWKKPFKFGIMRKKNMNAHNSHKDVEHQTRAALAFWRKTDKTIARLKEMGIEYEFTNFVSLQLNLFHPKKLNVASF